MTTEILNQLYESVVNACDNLHANKELINSKSVKKSLMTLGQWSESELDAQIPRYINQWRLHNLTLNNDIHASPQLLRLEQQLTKSRQELIYAKHVIAKLKIQLKNMLNV